MSSSRNAVVALATLVAIGAIIDGVTAKPPSKIVGGRLAEDGEFSFIVILSPRDNFVQFCAGSIIGPRHVLTAAHCVQNKRAGEIVVRSGIHRVGATNDVVSNVQRIILHPQYFRQDNNLVHDIAILVLEQDMNVEGRVMKVQLPNQQPDLNRFYFAAGWGKNGLETTEYQFDLKVLDVQLTDERNCQGKWSKTGELVCGYNENGNVCNGDSGGPLVGGGRLTGVISASSCQVGVRDVYVNVYHYLDWINSSIRQTSGY